MVVPGDQWPIFLYADCDYDPEEPWKGLLKSAILVSVNDFMSSSGTQYLMPPHILPGIQICVHLA